MHNPEQQAMVRQKAELMKSVLESMPERDRDILVRFYLARAAAGTNLRGDVAHRHSIPSFEITGESKIWGNGKKTIIERTHFLNVLSGRMPNELVPAEAIH